VRGHDEPRRRTIGTSAERSSAAEPDPGGRDLTSPCHAAIRAAPAMADKGFWRRLCLTRMYERARHRASRSSVGGRTVALVQIKDDNRGYHAVDSSVEIAYHPHCGALAGSKGRDGVDRRRFSVGVRLAELIAALGRKSSYLPADQWLNRRRDFGDHGHERATPWRATPPCARTAPVFVYPYDAYGLSPIGGERYTWRKSSPVDAAALTP
jgi:hypothetical protein